MSPDERQMISGLFDRLRGFGPPQKDRDAETLINQSLRSNADAGYMLVQSVLVQENVIEQQGARVAELEGRVRDLEDQVSRSQASQPASGGFLGGLFGGGAKPASVPTTGRPQPGFIPGATQGAQRSPWGQQGAAQQGGGQPQGGYAPQGGYPQPMQQGGMMAPQAAPAGGGFMRTAMATAAGVAGGMLVANSISSMMNGGHGAGHGSAQAAGAGSIGHDQQPAQNAGYDANDPAYGQTAAVDGNDPGYDPQPVSAPAYEDNDPGVDSGGGWGGEDV